MKFVVQRVSNASVEVKSKIVGEIEKGFLVLVGIKIDDTKEIADFMVSKLAKLRIFEDEAGKMNLSIKDVKGKLLLVSQFTLYANCKGGNRPDFLNAAKPEYAKELYEYVVQKCKQEGIEVQTGIFREEMKVRLLNDGPVTIIMDSSEIMNK